MFRLYTEPPANGIPATTLAAIEAQLANSDPVTLASKGPDWIAEALVLAESIGSDSLTLETEPALTSHEKLATESGLTLTRDLLQLRRPLPLAKPWSLDVRPFHPGIDDAQWLRVNNRAFDWHPEQGGWSTKNLHERMEEPWFDPDGFLIHETAGQIDGFCWTKIHHDIDPPLGEIFVIGVDPSAATRGLGRSLLRAGLDHLANQGITDALLYVEADNEPATNLYRSEGFKVHQRHCWWSVRLT